MVGINFSNYTPPGVYVDSGATPTLVTTGVAPTEVCLIGTGVGYHTYTETVSFASGSTVSLTQKGINPDTIVVRGYITDPNASGQSVPHTFVEDEVGTPHDYSVVTNTSGGAVNSTTTITKTADGDIETAYPQVTVTYRYTDATYHGLHQFDDASLIADTYGPALNPTTGAIASPLTFAAEVAIQNGATRIYAIALDPTKGTLSQQFADAYQVLSATNTNVNVVVPLFDGVTDGAALGGMLTTLNAALLADANKGVLRVAAVGLDSAYAGNPTAVAALAAGVGSPRIVLAYPNQLQFYNGVTNATIVVDGFYLAAAFGGILVRQDPQMPLTAKYVAGFSGLPETVVRTLTNPNKNLLAENGVAVVDLDRAGRMRVRHGLTTAGEAGGILNRELSLVRAQDALYVLLQDQMESSGLIGTPIDEQTALAVKAMAAGALETAKAEELIRDYNSLAVREQTPPSGDPTVIEVKFAYRPMWPLNYILVIFSVDITTGDVVNTQLQAVA